MISQKKNNISNKYLWIVAGIFFLLYCSISLVNHYNFRASALDLGLYTNALYDYAHFRWADSLMIKPFYENLLGGHFSLYLLIFSPLYLVFGTYTLLIVQILFILLGGWGVYRYFTSFYSENLRLAVITMIGFWLFFGIYSALSFDYHNNVIAAMIVPWFFYFFKKGKRVVSFLLLAAILVGKENMALWMIFVLLGLMLEYRRNRSQCFFAGTMAFFALIWFVVVILVFIPSFSVSSDYTGFLYSVLGKNPGEALVTLVLHPFETLKNLFVNHNNSPFGDYVKLELHLLLMLSGLPFLIFKPQYLIMLIPIYFQKLFHDNYLMWGVSGQYAIEFAPILILGSFSVIAELKNDRWQKVSLVILLLGVAGSTLRVMDNTVFYTNKNKIRFYKASHYQRDIDVHLVHEKLKLIPDDAIVSAESKLVPHLALRDKIYQFPLVKDAEFIVFTSIENTYPLTEDQFNQRISDYRNSLDWEVLFENEDLTILRKKTQLK